MAAQGLVFDAIFGSNHLVTIPSQPYRLLTAGTERLDYVPMRVTCQGGKMTWVRLGWVDQNSNRRQRNSRRSPALNP
jgi:hypothetical protein